MLAAGESSEVIQAHCRWRTDQSIRIYARLNADQFARRVSVACTQRASSVVVASRLNDLPLDADANVALAAQLANLGCNAAAIDLLFPLRACALSVDGFLTFSPSVSSRLLFFADGGDLPRSAFLVDRVGLLSTLAFYPPRSSHLLRLSLQ